VVEGRDTKIFNREVDTTYNGIEIKSIRTFHDGSQGAKRGENLLFKFIVDGTNFCHLGDLGHVLGPNAIQELGKIDVLFVPVGNVFTIGPAEAWEVISAISPHVVIPMHYRVGGLSLSIKPIEPFLENAEEESIVKVGNEMDFEFEDLPEKMEIWVFTL
jgi:L-ascorbate metabolism protein UlaG (beta-lactamase superfamily)